MDWLSASTGNSLRYVCFSYLFSRHVLLTDEISGSNKPPNQDCFFCADWFFVGTLFLRMLLWRIFCILFFWMIIIGTSVGQQESDKCPCECVSTLRSPKHPQRLHNERGMSVVIGAVCAHIQCRIVEAHPPLPPTTCWWLPQGCFTHQGTPPPPTANWTAACTHGLRGMRTWSAL